MKTTIQIENLSFEILEDKMIIFTEKEKIICENETAKKLAKAILFALNA